MQEFTIIDQYFNKPLLNPQYTPLGIGDDAAILRIPPSAELITSVDTQIINVHFLPSTAAFDIGYKSLAISLSDIAAMGGHAFAVLLSLTLPHSNEKWLDEFAQGFFNLAKKYNIDLVGGNLSQGPTLTINTTTFGWVPEGQALLRSGAQINDDIYVTGTLGGAGAALNCLKDNRFVSEQLLEKLNRPNPRLPAGLALRSLANACIDISDGLYQDLYKLLHMSHASGSIQIDQLPLPPDITRYVSLEVAQQLALTAGDDYELCFTAAPIQRQAIETALNPMDCTCHRIGKVMSGTGLNVYDKTGHPVTITKTGYEHFR